MTVIKQSVILRFTEGSPGKAKLTDLILSVIYTPRYPTLPGVYSPVEAGEVARTACRRGGDLPRGLRFRLRMTRVLSVVLQSSGVCFPVEAGEVAYVTRLREGDPA